jgi:o-succinylbenzoate---CoA ligase
LDDSTPDFQHRIEQLIPALPHQPNAVKILLVERHPLQFLASFIATSTTHCHLFLCNPDWGTQEWQQVFEQVEPDFVLQNGTLHKWQRGSVEAWKRGSVGEQVTGFSLNFSLHPSSLIPYPSSLILIPTGGSSGKIRFVMHTWQTLLASVEGFRQYFRIDRVHSCCTLPIYHVSGLMQFLRSFTSGGVFAFLPFKQLEAGQIPDFPIDDFFISLVPTQLQRSLNQPELTDWLAQFRTVLLGGAPAWTDLLVQARHYNIPLALTYGMTETASQIATLKPEDFLQGIDAAGQVLPHASVSIQNAAGEALAVNQTGIVTVQAKSLAIGYYPDRFPPNQPFRTDDLGFWDDQGFLHIVSRNSQKIITGGENVFPAEVEAAIHATGCVQDVCVVGTPDYQWGQIVTAIYVAQNADHSLENMQTLLRAKLSKFKCPKRWISVQCLPRNANGKVNYALLKQLIH